MHTRSNSHIFDYLVIGKGLMGAAAALRFGRTFLPSFILVFIGAALFITSDSILATSDFILMERLPVAKGSRHRQRSPSRPHSPFAGSITPKRCPPWSLPVQNPA